MYNSVIVANNIKTLSKKKSISLKSLFEDCGIGRNAMSHMTNGSMPKADTLAKIADYLNCSVDYLLGRTDQPSYTASITGDKNVIQQGSINNSPVNFNTNAQLNEIETELINILRTFTVKQKMKLLNYAYDIKENDIK